MNLRIPVIITIVFISNVIFCRAQPPTLDVVGTGQGGGSVKYNDPSAIGNKKAAPLEYSDVRGKYMWDNDWHPGLIIFKNDHGVKMPQVKLNLLTQDIHYLSKDGSEMAADKGLVKKLILYSSKDTASVIGVFRSAKVADSKLEQYFEQLNQGKIMLLKRAVASMKKLPYDPSVGKTEYRFFSTIDYFIQNGTEIKPINSLNKTAVSSTLSAEQLDEEWLSKNKNKLKSEDDVVAFFNHLNEK